MRPRRARRIARLYGGAELCGFFTPVIFKKMNTYMKWRNACEAGAPSEETDRLLSELSNAHHEGIYAAFKAAKEGVPHSTGRNLFNPTPDPYKRFRRLK